MTTTDNMVWIPSGLVEIGSPEPHLAGLAGEQHYTQTWFDDEAPQHTRALDGFWIDRYPVTNAEFAEFAAATGWVTGAERRGDGMVYGPDYWQPIPGISWRRPHPDIDAPTDRPDHPAVHVDHDDATAYAQWARKRLPTEAEWEYAAHGPTWAAWPWGSQWSRLVANTAEYWADSPMRGLADWKQWYTDHWREHGPAPATTTVGAFPLSASPFGCHDMAGNVVEWTASTYRFYSAGNYDDGFGAAARLGYLVARGGSWKMMRLQTRTSERICGVPDYEAYDPADVEHHCTRERHWGLLEHTFRTRLDLDLNEIVLTEGQELRWFSQADIAATILGFEENDMLEAYLAQTRDR